MLKTLNGKGGALHGRQDSHSAWIHERASQKEILSEKLAKKVRLSVSIVCGMPRRFKVRGRKTLYLQEGQRTEEEREGYQMRRLSTKTTGGLVK